MQSEPANIYTRAGVFSNPAHDILTIIIITDSASNDIPHFDQEMSNAGREQNGRMVTRFTDHNGTCHSLVLIKIYEYTGSAGEFTR